jgi:hypothetical protein
MDMFHPRSHLETTRRYWDTLQKILIARTFEIDGTALDIPSVIAVAK